MEQDEKRNESAKHEIAYRHSPQFISILQHLNCSLLVSTYQAGKVVAISVNRDGLSIQFSNFQQAMGMAVSRERMAVGVGRDVCFLDAAHQLAGQLDKNDRSTACYLARSSHTSGDIHVHEMAWVEEPDGENLWAVNTLFSCLCTFEPGYSFVPRWKPAFVSQLAAEDRCHLNGVAVANGKITHVSAFAQTDTPSGWRANKKETGCVIDFASGEVVADQLCMPHSPRFQNGQLLVLNSGHGQINTIDLPSGQVTTIETVPGYTRGLAFAGQFAFVGMSKIRETAIFGGLPVGEGQEPLRCGVAIVDLQSGQSVAWFEFLNGVEEVFAVETIPGQVALRGPHIHADDHQEVWVVPADIGAGRAP